VDVVVVSMGVDGLGEMSDALRLRLGREASGSTSMGLGGGCMLFVAGVVTCEIVLGGCVERKR
jgi:hypothetical protein